MQSPHRNHDGGNLSSFAPARSGSRSRGADLSRTRFRGKHGIHDLHTALRAICLFAPKVASVRATFGLSGAEIAQVVSNTRSAAAIPRESCRAGRLRFDLAPEEFLRDGTIADSRIDCDNP